MTERNIMSSSDLMDFVVGDSDSTDDNNNNSSDNKKDEGTFNKPLLADDPIFMDDNDFYDDDDEEEDDNNIDEDDDYYEDLEIAKKIELMSTSTSNNNNYNNNNNNNNNTNNSNNSIKLISSRNVNNNQKKESGYNYNTPLSIKFGQEYSHSVKFLKEQGITMVGQLAITEDFIYIEGVFDDPLLEVLQDECRKIVMEQEGIEGLIRPDFPVETLDKHSTIMALNGYTKEDEAFLREIRIITLQHLVDAKNNPLVQNSSRMRFYCNSAEKVINFANRISQDRVSPSEDIKVYTYVNTPTLKLIDIRKSIRSVHAIFDDYIKTETSTRFNHPWRKIYFKLLTEASSHLGIPAPSDLELYSYFVWKNSKIYQNCVDGQMGIHFFWQEIPLTANLKSFELEYEHKITINLTKAIKSGLKVYICKNGGGEAKVASLADCKAEAQSKYWGFYTTGKDPYETIPHGMVVAPQGLLSFDYFTTDISKKL